MHGGEIQESPPKIAIPELPYSCHTEFSGCCEYTEARSALCIHMIRSSTVGRGNHLNLRYGIISGVIYVARFTQFFDK